MLDTLAEIQSGEPGTILATFGHYKGIKLINSTLNPITNCDSDGSSDTPSNKVAKITDGTSSTFTSFLSPSFQNSTASQNNSYGKTKSFTSRGRGRNFPVRNLRDM